MSLQPRVVLVHRRTEYDELLMRHGTHQAAAFFLQTRRRDIADLVTQHEEMKTARQVAAAAIPNDWRRAELERSDLHQFSFAAEDIVTVVGQDGLVANVAKYLEQQPVVGINPSPNRNPGVLVPHAPQATARLLISAADGNCTIERRTMVTATTDDGQTLHAVNEVYFGHRTHQSAKYRVELDDGTSERQSSSGILAGTGTGATGWLRSIWQARRSPLELPAPEEPTICWFVREAWPSQTTGTSLTEGLVAPGMRLRLHAENDELVCFGDGIESDSLRIGWGQTIDITTAAHTLHLVTA